MFRLTLLIFLTGLSVIGTSAQTQQAEKPSSNDTDSSKPKAKNTDATDKEIVEGTVTLKVTFLANGEIGDVVFVSGTPDEKALIKAGLLKQAIAAAKQIKFEPAKRKGKPIAVTKIVSFKFTIY